MIGQLQRRGLIAGINDDLSLCNITVSQEHGALKWHEYVYFKLGRTKKKGEKEISWCKEARCSTQALNEVQLKEK